MLFSCDKAVNNPNAIDNLKPFTPGDDPRRNLEGRTTKNRSTIARKILEMRGMLPVERMQALKERFPEIQDSMTVEEVMTIVMAENAIMGEDKHYRALMDSAYGSPKAEVEHSGSIAIPITGFTIIQDNEPNHKAPSETSGGDTGLE